MPKRSLFLPGLLFAASAFGQAPPSALDVANLQEDVRGLTQKVNDLTLRVEQLEHQPAESHTASEGTAQGYATLVQLNAAVAELNRSINAAPAKSRPAADAAPVAEVPKTGISYIVQRGDTVELIAKKTGARVSDIVKFNQLADPSHIQVGQSLFVPGGK